MLANWNVGYSRRAIPATFQFNPAARILNKIESALLFNIDLTTVTIDFLMPNGIIIQHEVNTSVPLAEIKAEVWEKASECPLYWLLHDQAKYQFTCIQFSAENTELIDENLCLQEIRMFFNVLRVEERKGNEKEKQVNFRIGQLIGKQLKDFDALKSPEVNDFRWKMRNECDQVVRQRNEMSWENKVLYLHPCNLATSETLPAYIKETISDIHFLVHFSKDKNVESFYTIPASVKDVPNYVLGRTFRKIYNKPESGDAFKYFMSDHILKILGHEEFLICQVPLCQYIAIREHICNGNEKSFQLVVVPKSYINVNIDLDHSYLEIAPRTSRSSVSSSTLNKKKSVNSGSAWVVNENLKVKIGTLSSINIESEETSKVMLKAGLYHASTLLCQTLIIPPAKVIKNSSEIEHVLEFPIHVCNLPRNSRLCIAVYETTSVVKNKSGTNDPEYVHNAIAWVNTSVYDYRGHLKGGSMTLYCWNMSEEEVGADVELPNPLGTVVSNPNHNRALSITITFSKYMGLSTITFPTKEIILSIGQGNNVEEIPSKADYQELLEISDRDPLMEIHEQEIKKLWSFRRFCMKKIPNILSKLLQCIQWNSHNEVAELITMLEEWPKLSVDRAMELLDYANAEPCVRNYAIDCLSHMSDDDLLLYLLQLVQALKHENYLYCDLVQFLLERALKNRRIGHFLFWYLRSEMHVASVSIRFGLILEAYCRGSLQHMTLLQKQLDVFEKLKGTQKVVREHRSNREKAIAALHEALNNRSVKNSLTDFLNPINPIFAVNTLKIEKCKCMDSKMQPLWLVFGNRDPRGEDVYLLYKSGDDIRQDMLTLQMIRIMDKLWKSHGFDFRLNPYSCLSTDYKEGVISVVKNSQTIANIQRQKGGVAAVLNRKAILEWLKEQNPTAEQFDKAINEFTLSCAGYSVATYVLGIADRHNDNIMIMPNGQLFHIDFGHILGHFKEKFGIRRERQPFVITYDLIHVLQKGTNSKSENFEQFKTYCEDAFMLLRKYGSFIISLFAMMLSTGLPELQSEKDLDYLRDTLKLDLNEEDARLHFKSKLNEALQNAWKASLNWALHSLSRNNK